MLKNLKYSYVLLGILITIGGYYYYFVKQSSTTSSTSTTTIESVETGSITQTIDVVGTAELVNEQSIRFNKVGTITKVNFKDGDKVKKGAIIAEIDNSDGEDTVKEAQISLDNAKIALSDLYKGSDQSQILQAQNSVTNGQKNLDIANQELSNLKVTQANSLQSIEDDINNAKKELTNLENNLTISQNDLELSKQKLTDDLSNSVSNKSNTIKQIETSFLTEKTAISKTIDDMDVILGVTSKNKNLNDDYEIYLGAKNPNLKYSAEDYLSSSIASYNDMVTAINAYDNSGDTEKLIVVLKQIQATYTVLQKALDYTYQTIDNSVASTSLSDSTISSLKSSMYNYKTNAENKIASINSSINTLNTLTNTDLLSSTNNSTLASKESSITAAELAITKQEQQFSDLEKNYQTTKQKNEIDLQTKLQSIESAKKSLEVAKESLKEILEGPTSNNVKKAQNNITQAELKLQSAKQGLDDYKLIAPFDGVVRKIDYMVGDNIVSDSDKYVYIENPNLVRIPVALDQVDIVKVEVGKKASITFDAYPTIKVEGEINTIDYTPVKTSGVVTYTAYIVMTDKTFNKKILSGMTADIEIITASKENILTLSSSAITSEDDKYYVNLLKNGQTVKTEVTTGLSSGGKTEIVSGLALGDTVSVTSFDSTTSTTKTTTTSLFGGGNRSSSGKSSSSSSSRDMGGPPGGF